MSRNHAAAKKQPLSDFEHKIYALFDQSSHFSAQLKVDQSKDPLIRKAIEHIDNQHTIESGRLKRVQTQLRIENGILTQSGRPVVPPSLIQTVVKEYHNTAHFEVDKIYSLLKERFYWPNMFDYIRSFISACEACQKTKCDTSPPKAPLVKMFIPNAPMQFVSLDIAYLPKDHSGYQYMLLVGDVFSKYIQAIPLKDQTAPTIADAFLKHWV